MSVPYTTTYGVVHDVLLDTAYGISVSPHDLRLLLAIAEHGGTIEGASDDLVGAFGSNATAIRRSALALTDRGLVDSSSKRGVGLRLTLTSEGRGLALGMLAAINEALTPDVDEALAA